MKYELIIALDITHWPNPIGKFTENERKIKFFDNFFHNYPITMPQVKRSTPLDQTTPPSFLESLLEDAPEILPKFLGRVAFKS